MSEAPERLYRADWIDGLHMAHRNIWSGPSTEYIRADIHAARIAELERQLADEQRLHMGTLARPASAVAREIDMQRQLAEARDQALEDAAQECTTLYLSRTTEWNTAVKECAAAIRAMKGAKL